MSKTKHVIMPVTRKLICNPLLLLFSFLNLDVIFYMPFLFIITMIQLFTIMYQVLALMLYYFFIYMLKLISLLCHYFQFAMLLLIIVKHLFYLAMMCHQTTTASPLFCSMHPLFISLHQPLIGHASAFSTTAICYIHRLNHPHSYETQTNITCYNLYNKSSH